MTNTDSYDLDGLRISVTGAEPVRRSIARRLAHFTRINPGQGVDLELHYRREPLDLAFTVARGRAVMEDGGCRVTYDELARALFIDIPGRARALHALDEGQVRISHGEDAERDAWLLSHAMFNIPFSEFAKTRGRYMIHAACLAEEGRGLLVAGASGSGKSTLTLALVRAGFQFLGDDTALLCRREGRVNALAFADEIDLNQQTASFFPELSGFPWGQTLTGRGKCPANPQKLYGIVPGRDCVPEVLVFPRPSLEPVTRIAPMARDEALFELLCNVVRTDPGQAQAHLDMLGALVRQCRLCRIHTGRDFESIPGMMRQLLRDGRAGG